MRSLTSLWLALGLCVMVNAPSIGLGASSSKTCFTIRVVDEQTGRGVPLVELRTVSHIAWWTDSAGVVAFDEPGLMGQEVFLYVSSPGYEYPKDFFDNRGLKLRPVAGG